LVVKPLALDVERGRWNRIEENMAILGEQSDKIVCDDRRLPNTWRRKRRASTPPT
jgi:16S rRNA C967 or C1407 C5-methylase (RsmB/RsmF family)